MTVTQAQLVSLWEDVLGLSNLKRGETVVILIKPEANPRNIEAACDAAINRGATALSIRPHIVDAPLNDNPIAMDAMRQADMVIDLLGLHLLRGGEQGAVLAGGTRVLYVTEPPDILARMMPSKDDKRRVKAAEACIKKAKSMHVASEAGTDFTVELGAYPILCEYGYADEPGHWDHWPGGFIATWPNEKSAHGTVVIDRGDIMLPFKSYVQTPIRLVIEKGYIRRIEGDGDAEYLGEYMNSFNDREAYAVSHLGWGLQPKAQWTALGLYDKAQTNGNDARAFYGNFMFSTGPNTDGGGTRDTLCHLDIPMRNCSVDLDGTPITLKGDVIPKNQRAPALGGSQRRRK